MTTDVRSLVNWWFVAVVLICGLLWLPQAAGAFGDATAVTLRSVSIAGRGPARPTATSRLAWALRQRTSIQTVLQGGTVALDSPALFESPVLYWSGDEAFGALSESEILGLRRFVEFGGFLFVDDATPDGHGFDNSIRRALTRAFGEDSLVPVANDHTLFRSFYLLSRPVGRVAGDQLLEGVTRSGRLAVVYSRHDMGGAWARDNLGTYLHTVVPGGRSQREMAFRLGVNLIMYALCLDYKDDQVHSPYIMRRRAGQP